MWNEADEYDIPDDSWHVTDYYEKTRERVFAMADSGPCKEYKELDLDFACKYPMKVIMIVCDLVFVLHHNLLSVDAQV